MAEVESSDIPKVIGVPTEDPEEEDRIEKAKRKAKQIDALMNKVKAKTFGKKKWSSPLGLVTTIETAKEKESGSGTAGTGTGTSKEDTASKKTAKKDKKKTKVAKSDKSSKSKERQKKESAAAKVKDVLGEDQHDLPDSTDESDGMISIPDVIEVFADDGTHDEETRAADAERETKKYESMHNSHNALRVLERADSGKSLKEMAKNRRISATKPKRTRSVNAQQALERVNSSKPLSAMQREVKSRERALRNQTRKRPTAAAGVVSPRRTSSVSQNDVEPKNHPKRASSLDVTKALADADDEALKELYGEAQRKSEREQRRKNGGGGGEDTSSRRSKRSIDEDLDGGRGSRRSHGRSIDDDLEESQRSSRRTYGTVRSLDEDFDDSKRSSRRNQRSIDIEWDDDVHKPSSKHSMRSVDVHATDAESKRRAAERRARRESHRNASNQTRDVLHRADSGKSLKDLANDSRRRRSTSVGSHKGSHHKRNNSTGAIRSHRASVGATAEGLLLPTDSMRMKDIEAQIEAAEKALKGDDS
eukprot:CAMPEP_0113633240 /NCGR_PEP_ID=MMETSP0017_2-20120614/17298_1 /TAXON_ID=2856 /ORGANISM="Cylindrotheca closterium" /LENGTH=532 /DNA_ID=CAMNT_0000543869 /DNA_START=33 /DNA_END=1631 /DNA_ORIENTATION=- /assembly_acc=CAM_ASM_000147